MPNLPPIQPAALPSFAALFDIVFQPIVLLIVGALVLAIFGLMSIVLLHHWKTYSVNAKRVKRAMFIYFGGGGTITLFIVIFGIIALAQ